MTSLVAAIRALIIHGPKVVKVATALDAPSPTLEQKLAATETRVNREIGQVCHAFCRAIAALAVGREPTDAEINQVMEEAIDDPAFPHRAYRLLGAARKSGDRRRREFLAAMLFGHSFKLLPDDQRERVDMVIEQLTPADVEVLFKIAEAQYGEDPQGQRFRRMYGHVAILALVNDTDFRLVTRQHWNEEEQNIAPTVYTDPSLKADRIALSILTSLNCVVLGEVLDGGELADHGYTFKSAKPTLLGDLVVKAIAEVRPDLAAAG